MLTRCKSPDDHIFAGDAIAEEVGVAAAARDADGAFPVEAFAALRRRGLVAHPPLADGDSASLFRILAAVGRGDLSAGRIFEGHVNARSLLRHFGTTSQWDHDATAADKLLGVWNTDHPTAPLWLDGTCLRGKKVFASGIDGLSHAIVTVTQPAGRLMILVPVSGLSIDRTWWRPLGMRASGSHVVDFTGLVVETDWVIGSHGDYIREPWFSGGALRFVAVHVGGMHAVFEAALKHLRLTNRIADPHQVHRLGRMAAAVETGYAWLERAALFWSEATTVNTSGADAALVAIANTARGIIETSALAVLEDAERSVGAAGLIAPHPLERLIRDLRTYLRQPNPDGALTAVGTAVAHGTWSPGRNVSDNT
jgi:alkylation response protein AidB-like acyl-CoA dehydrogenase